jgi:hypothetical protein
MKLVEQIPTEARKRMQQHARLALADFDGGNVPNAGLHVVTVIAHALLNLPEARELLAKVANGDWEGLEALLKD